MIRRITYALAAAAVTASAVVAAPLKNDPGLNAYQRFQGGPPTTLLPTPEKDKPKSTKVTEAEKRPSESAAALRAQEEANLLRRLAVCDRLKQIALEQGDAKLEDEAIRLEQKAEEVYRQRTQSKPTAKSPTTPAEGRK